MQLGRLLHDAMSPRDRPATAVAASCDRCGSEMGLHYGAFGPFHCCSQPACGNTRLLTSFVPEAIYAASGRQLDI